MTKNQELGISFFMQGCDKNGTPTDVVKDLEKDFEGLTYSKAEGLLSKGKVKNVYTETYADSDKLRVYHPSEHKEFVDGEWVSRPKEVAREVTTVKFTFVFVGENRQATYDAFYDYITGGFRLYWDTARKKKIVLFCSAEYKPAEEQWYGSTPYIKLDIDVQNIYGSSTDI